MQLFHVGEPDWQADEVQPRLLREELPEWRRFRVYPCRTARALPEGVLYLHPLRYRSRATRLRTLPAPTHLFKYREWSEEDDADYILSPELGGRAIRELRWLWETLIVLQEKTREINSGCVWIRRCSLFRKHRLLGRSGNGCRWQ